MMSGREKHLTAWLILPISSPALGIEILLLGRGESEYGGGE